MNSGLSITLYPEQGKVSLQLDGGQEIFPPFVVRSDGQFFQIKPETNGTFSLAELQEFVEGYIEVVNRQLLPQLDSTVLVVNEDGLALRQPFNPLGTQIGLLLGQLSPSEQLVGPVVFVPFNTIE